MQYDRRTEQTCEPRDSGSGPAEPGLFDPSALMGNAAMAGLMGDAGMAERASGNLLPMLWLPMLEKLRRSYEPNYRAPEPPTEEEMQAAAGQSVEICAQPAGSEETEHRWIKVGDKEIGMEQLNEGEWPLPLIPTEFDDEHHTGRHEEPGAQCVPAASVSERWKDVDPECVLREAAPGTPTGPYGAPRWGQPPGLGMDGSVNHCQAAVAEVLDKCSADPQAAAAATDLSELRRLEEQAGGGEGAP